VRSTTTSGYVMVRSCSRGSCRRNALSLDSSCGAPRPPGLDPRLPPPGAVPVVRRPHRRGHRRRRPRGQGYRHPQRRPGRDRGRHAPGPAGHRRARASPSGRTAPGSSMGCIPFDEFLDRLQAQGRRAGATPPSTPSWWPAGWKAPAAAVVQWRGLRLEIVDMDGTRVDQVLVRALGKGTPPAGSISAQDASSPLVYPRL
jgi:hypothetical protein